MPERQLTLFADLPDHPENRAATSIGEQCSETRTIIQRCIAMGKQQESAARFPIGCKIVFRTAGSPPFTPDKTGIVSAIQQNGALVVRGQEWKADKSGQLHYVISTKNVCAVVAPPGSRYTQKLLPFPPPSSIQHSLPLSGPENRNMPCKP